MEGRACFNSLSPGTYLVTAQAVGFAGPRVVAIRVDRWSAEAITIQMEIAAVEESIVVTSSATAEPLRDVSKSMSVVGSEE